MAATTSLDDIRDDLVRAGKIIDASTLERDLALEADVVIAGSGAGGGVAAEILSGAGLSVIIVEEGPLRTARDFRMSEAEAYPDLYQDSAARKTADKAINILQGRCVGGGTTVNWTTSFRTPKTTLAHWANVYGLEGDSAEELAVWFTRAEARFGIAPWRQDPNANNAALERGAAKLGIPTGRIRRNVKGCADLGYCGMGCPLDAKLSTLVLSIPAALQSGATLITRARAWSYAAEADRIVALSCVGMDRQGTRPTERRITLRARVFIAAAGGIGTPALLLRSRLPDPHGVVGKRTFVHPVLVSAALMPEKVEGYYGAPQSVYSDHFLDSLSPEGPRIGYKLETPPLHPVLVATTLPEYGATHSERMRRLPNLQVILALLRDGFHPDSPGGVVTLRDDGSPVLDYPFTPYVWDGARRAFATMAEIQFAAGATTVIPLQGNAEGFSNWPAARSAIEGFALAPRTTRVVSAHVMGGAPFGPDPRRAVVNGAGRHHHLGNLYVADGSLFPTSIGANPQLSIFAVAAKIASGIARQLAPSRAPD